MKPQPNRFESGWAIVWTDGNPQLKRVKVENYNGQISLLTSNFNQSLSPLSLGVTYFRDHQQALEAFAARTIDAIRGHEQAISLLKIQLNSIKEEQKHEH